MAALSKAAAAEYLQLQEDLAEAYNTDDATRTFAVEPTHAQELNDQITERVDFLGRINVVPVGEIKGEKVLLGLNGPATGRTDTDENDREPNNLLDLKNNSYELFDTETDVSLKFATIDAWAKFPEFARKYLEAVQKRIALDRILIGWNGTHVAKQTSKTKYPLLQDVNKGWLQQARELIPEQVLKSADPAQKIKIGAGGNYANLDAAVHDVKQMIDPVFRDEGDLIVIVGSDLLAHEKGKLYAAQGRTPTEKERVEEAQVIDTYGGLPSFLVPFFPSKGILVTSWNNLSIYFQDSSWRRHLLENPKRSRVEDYNGRNEGYVIEQLGKFAYLESDSVDTV
ncbi:phage major capsid protein, P2 family [Pseudomonas sp. MWU13-3659]|uniref:phage major capsid protein, P2 family n=1 Tax=Pseudomonas sp. MWU13-3659 TaxID=2986964 RepID=UPI002074EC82|nr:phage major capsid protein, P2 family [Pseudomonas sp. MWU13-3659]